MPLEDRNELNVEEIGSGEDERQEKRRKETRRDRKRRDGK